MQQVRNVLGRSHGLPTPAWLLQFGARVIRTEAELVLKSRWVEPHVLTGSGFEFQYPKLDDALVDIASETPRDCSPSPSADDGAPSNLDERRRQTSVQDVMASGDP